MDKLVLEYADAMTQTPVEVPETLFMKLREKFAEAQLVELTATLAWENYRARFDHAFGVEAEGFSEGSYCTVPVRSEAYFLTARTRVGRLRAAHGACNETPTLGMLVRHHSLRLWPLCSSPAPMEWLSSRSSHNRFSRLPRSATS